MSILISLTINNYSLYLPRSFLFIDFIFCNVTNIRGFTLVLDVICASTKYSFAFLTRSKQVLTKILTCLFSILKKEGKEVRFVRVDEGKELTRSREFCKFVVDHNCTLQTTGGYCSSFNSVVERPHCDGHRATWISLGGNKHLPEKLWCFARTYWTFLLRRIFQTSILAVPYFKWSDKKVSYKTIQAFRTPGHRTPRL